MKLGIFLQHYFPYGGLQRDAARLTRSAEEATLVVSTSQDPPNDLDLLHLNAGGTTNHRKLARFSKACQTLQQFDRTIAFSRVAGTDFHFCGDTCFRERFQQRKPAIAALLPRYRFLLENEQRIFGPDSRTHIFFLADSEVPAFEKHYAISPSRYTILPPWLDPPPVSDPTPSSIRKERSLPDDALLLLFVASNYRLKGLDRAIQALAGLAEGERPCHLLVCGHDEAAPFQKLANELDVSSNVHFLGPRNDIPALMSSSDLLIHPARQEAAGMVLAEALVQGLPVVCTSVCGYAKYIDEAGCPTLSAEPSSEEIISKIKAALEHRASLVDSIRNWCDQPGRFKTADLILERIARGV